MKKKLLLLLLPFIALGICAAPRSLNQAQLLAQQFEKGQQIKLNKAYSPSKSLQLAYKALKSDAQPAYYIFNKMNGYVIISGDDKLPEILGYVDEGSFDWASAPDAFKEFMSQYECPIKLSSFNSFNEKMSLKNSSKSVGPLLGATIWNQSSPWNDLCPRGKDSKGNSFTSAVGCGATALAQIMYYHKYPLVGTGVKNAYTTNSYKFKVSSNFNTPYDWNNMLPAYSGGETVAQKKAVARFNYDVGVSMRMDYGPSSGTMTYFALTSLPKYFNYDKDMSHLYRECYSYDEWASIIKKELDEQRPILYAGYSQGGGHAYVCDGYNGDLFHINWGWNGSCNGYFYLFALVPESQGIGGGSADGYNYYQMATMGIHPPDNKDGLGVRNCLLYTDINFSKNQFLISESVSLDLSKIYNMSNLFKGDLLAQLIDQNSHIVKKDLGNYSNLSLDLEGTISNKSIDLDFSSVDDGNYYLLLKESASNSSEVYSVRNMNSASIDSIVVTVANGKVLIEKPVDSFDMQCNSIAPNDKLYRNTVNKVSFDLINNGTYDYNSEYCLKIHSKYRTIELAQYMVLVKKGKTEHVELLIDVPNLELGKVDIELFINPTNSSWHSKDEVLASIFKSNISIEDNPDGSAEYHLEKQIYFKDGNQEVESDMALLMVPIINTGGIGTKDIWAFVWGENKSIVYKKQPLYLVKNESKTIQFDFSGSNLIDGKEYSLSVRMKGNKWEYFDNRNFRKIFFTWHKSKDALETVQSNMLNYDGRILYNEKNQPIKVYDTIGRIMIESDASQIDLTSLRKGIYLVSNGYSILKIVR